MTLIGAAQTNPLPFVLPGSLTAGSICLLDTNCLLRYSTHSDANHRQVRRAVRGLIAQQVRPCTFLQNHIEGWNTPTRPTSRNGYGLTPEQAERRLRVWERIFERLPEDDTVQAQWRRLVSTYQVSGVQVHDARIVAMMLIHGARHLLTFNTADFVRYAPEGIVAFDPATV